MRAIKLHSEEERHTLTLGKVFDFVHVIAER